MSNYYSVPKLAVKLDVAGNTIRRHIQRYPEFFKSKIVGGVKSYSEESIPLLERIIDLYGEGMRKKNIRPILREEFQILNPKKSPEAKEGEQPILPGTVIELGPETRKFLAEVITKAFQK